MAQITKRQGHYDIEQEVGDPEDGKYITGNMTVGHGKTPNGSFSAKVKSSLVTDLPRNRKEARAAWMQFFDDAYDRLFAELDAERKAQLNETGKPGGQTNLLAGTNAMKAAAKGEPQTKNGKAKATTTKKTAKKPAGEAKTDKTAAV